MGHTLNQRIDDLITQAGTYDVTFQIQRSVLAQAIEWGRDEAVYSVFPERSNLFKSLPTPFNDGDALPEDWLGIIRGWVVSGSNKYPIRYIQVQKIPAAKVRQNVKATATSPVLFIADDELHLLGTGSGFLVYYQWPAQLYYDDRNDIDETKTDTIPTDAEPLVIRAAFELLLMMLVSQKQLFQLTQVQVDQVEKARLRFYEDMTKGLNQDFTRQ